MKSLFYNISKEELKKIICNSSTIREVIEKTNLGLDDASGNRRTLFRIIKEYGFDKELEELKKRSKEFLKNRLKMFKKQLLNEDIFCKNSICNRKNLRDRIIKNNLIEYKCHRCGIIEYNNEPISLQLHHINGIRDDNRLENLTFLCPNCHSQTDSYSGRNKFILKRVQKEKNKEIKRQEKEKLIEERRKILNEIDMNSFGWVMEVAKKWSVSWTQAKRWIKKYYPDLKYYQRNDIDKK